mgnify:CR=1 FL=1
MKETLELEIAKLQKVVAQHEEQAKDLRKDLSNAQQKLTDYSKPKLKSEHLTNIQDAIETAIEEFDFSMGDNYEVDFALDGDQVYLDRIDFNDESALAYEIYVRVENLFGVAEESSDDDESSSE